MKSQPERERQTLDIAEAVLWPAALWTVVVVAALLSVAYVGLDVRFQRVVGVAVFGYLPTVATWLLVARLGRRIPTS